jgi:hypothetical protein
MTASEVMEVFNFSPKEETIWIYSRTAKPERYMAGPSANG